jgi:hypothetical protein
MATIFQNAHVPELPEQFIAIYSTLLHTQIPALMFFRESGPDACILLAPLFEHFDFVSLIGADFFTGESPITDVLACLRVFDVLNFLIANFTGECKFGVLLQNTAVAWVKTLACVLRHARRFPCLADFKEGPGFLELLCALIAAVPAMLDLLRSDQHGVALAGIFFLFHLYMDSVLRLDEGPVRELCRLTVAASELRSVDASALAFSPALYFHEAYGRFSGSLRADAVSLARALFRSAAFDALAEALAESDVSEGWMRILAAGFSAFRRSDLTPAIGGFLFALYGRVEGPDWALTQAYLDAETFYSRPEQLAPFGEAVASFDDFGDEVAFTAICHHFLRLVDAGCEFAPEVVVRFLDNWRSCHTGDLWEAAAAVFRADRDLLDALSPQLAVLATAAIGEQEGAEGAAEESQRCYVLLSIVTAGPNPQIDHFAAFFADAVTTGIERDWQTDGLLIEAATSAVRAGFPGLLLLESAFRFCAAHFDDADPSPSDLSAAFLLVLEILFRSEGDLQDPATCGVLAMFWELFVEQATIEGTLIPWVLAEVVAWRIQRELIPAEDIPVAYEIAVGGARGSVMHGLAAFDIAVSLAHRELLPHGDLQDWVDLSRELVQAGGVFREQERVLHQWLYQAALVGDVVEIDDDYPDELVDLCDCEVFLPLAQALLAGAPGEVE